jgi:fatty-acid desaturase
MQIFAVAALPLPVSLVAWWIIPPHVLVPLAMTLLKEYFYLMGGYIINYYGHQAEGEEHQSNIPWWLMLITLFVLGEGWHELHHDAPYSARRHPVWDPAFWVICASARLGLVSDVAIAEKVGDRQYVLRWMFIRT